MIKWQCDVIVNLAQCRLCRVAFSIGRLHRFVEVVGTYIVGYLLCYDFLNQLWHIREIRNRSVVLQILSIQVMFRSRDKVSVDLFLRYPHCLFVWRSCSSIWLSICLHSFLSVLLLCSTMLIPSFVDSPAIFKSLGLTLSGPVALSGFIVVSCFPRNVVSTLMFCKVGVTEVIWLYWCSFCSVNFVQLFFQQTRNNRSLSPLWQSHLFVVVCLCLQLVLSD